jgi:hypothetical protein
MVVDVAEQSFFLISFLRRVDRNLEAGAGLDRTAMRWRGRVQWKTRLLAIQTGFVTRVGA